MSAGAVDQQHLRRATVRAPLVEQAALGQTDAVRLDGGRGIEAAGERGAYMSVCAAAWQVCEPQERETLAGVPDVDTPGVA